jgi:MbtH protein
MNVTDVRAFRRLSTRQVSRGARTVKDIQQFTAVNNDEGQYSIWPSDKEIPLGWKSSGKVGTKEECLSYVREVWTDMRPVSVRRMAGNED